jgi:5-dehydro-2-deoxygluconokinase
MSSYEVLTMGRIGVDLYPQQVGVGLDQVESFGKYLGGSASNVAVAAARYGRRTAVITRTGDDPFGRFLHQALRNYGVDDRYVTPVKHLPTPVTFCEIFPPDDFPLYFYRLPKAPDLEIYESELDRDAIQKAGVFWVTVTGLSEEPSRTATLAALEARARKDITVLDLDYRPMFWPSREEARHWVQQALPHATVAVGNLDECDTAVGTSEPLEAARRLHDAGVKLAIVKQGPKGVLASARGAWGDGQSPHEQGGSGGDRPPGEAGRVGALVAHRGAIPGFARRRGGRGDGRGVPSRTAPAAGRL